MAKKYQKDVEFLLVYVREAHPVDGWQVAQNEKEGVLIESAKTYEQKDEHATSCARNLGITFTTLVDGMDNTAEKAYTAWPDRYYLVGTDGRIVVKGAPGPAGFRAAVLDTAITKLLGR
ncbi:MAG: deiodinase [Acidobacteria bacterium]|nr:deiodinase [Acidobacteriota bacterium]